MVIHKEEEMMMAQYIEPLTSEYAAVLEKAKIWNREDCRKHGQPDNSAGLRAMDTASARFISHGQTSGTTPEALLRILTDLREDDCTLDDGYNWGPVEAETLYGLMAGKSQK